LAYFYWVARIIMYQYKTIQMQATTRPLRKQASAVGKPMVAATLNRIAWQLVVAARYAARRGMSQAVLPYAYGRIVTIQKSMQCIADAQKTNASGIKIRLSVATLR
jgi:hypothetical protein